MRTHLLRSTPAAVLIPLSVTLGLPAWVTITLTTITVLLVCVQTVVTQIVRLIAADRLPPADAARILDSHRHR